jgi:hypothetical protein
MPAQQTQLNLLKFYGRKGSLKVSTNEIRGGLNLASFDWSPFMLFTLKFSEESVQTLSSEGPKTAQRTLFSVI